MKIIFIRHAEPDYSKDSLTEKGFREAGLLAGRTKNWKVDQFYCSPLGRAQDTARPTLEAHHVTLTDFFPAKAPDVIRSPEPGKAIVYPWLREFTAPLPREDHPMGQQIPWDFSPEFLNDNPVLYDRNHWWEAPIIQKAPIKENYDWICTRLDSMLKQHGYVRSGLNYQTGGADPASDSYMRYDGTTLECMKNLDDSEPVIVCFCHLGVMLAMVSHLLNTSPYTLWHGFFTAPASVTILNTEERIPGHAMFRCQTIGDTSHLRSANEPISFYGSFDPPFQM